MEKIKFVLLILVLNLGLSAKAQDAFLHSETKSVLNYFKTRNFQIQNNPEIRISEGSGCFSGLVDHQRTLIQLSVNADTVERKVTLAHELTHVYRSQVNSHEELWLDEGLAKFIEYQFSSVWPVSYDTLLAQDSYLNLGNTSLSGGSNFSCAGDGYRASFYFVLYLYNHFGGEYLIREMLSSPLSGWENILSSIQSAIDNKVISMDEKWISKESILRHFAVAVWLNDGFLAKYSLMKLDAKFVGLKQLRPKLNPQVKINPMGEIRIFYSKEFIPNSQAKEVYSVFEGKSVTIQRSQLNDNASIYIYLYF